jgi:hypothetical protein
MADLEPLDCAEIQERLREAYSSDPETRLRDAMGRIIADPAKPRDAKNRARLHPMLLAILAAGLFILGTFVYFSFSRT